MATYKKYEKYKDSGIEWIGEIPEHWSTIRFKTRYESKKEIAGEHSSEYERLALTLNGVIKRSKTDSDGLQPKEFDTYQILKSNDFVFKMIDLQNISTSRVGLSPYTGLVSPAYLRFSPKRKDENTRYTYYYLMSLYYNCVFNNLGGEGVRSSLNATDMGNLYCPYPSSKEQAAIASYLDDKVGQIDSVIAEAKASIDEYKSWKASIIYETVTKGLDPTAEMKDSGVEWIGAIPADWTVVKGHRIIKSTQNGLTRRDLEQSSGNIVLKLKNITESGSISYSYINRIALSDYEKATYALENGDLLFVRVNGSRHLVGKCAIYEDCGELTAYNDHIIRVKLSNLCNKRFIQLYLLSTAGKVEIELHTSTSAGQFTISGEGLRDITFVLPPIDIQATIVDYLNGKTSQIDSLISEKEALIADLEAYKKSLIFEVVTGKRKVTASEKTPAGQEGA